MSRQEKLAQAIKKEISGIIQEELKDPRLGFMTITAVELTPDYKYANVFFSVLGQEQDYKKAKDALNSASGFIRRLIAQRIRFRFVPEIVFKEDRSCEYGFKIEKILNEIKELNEPKKISRQHKKK
jgi:ribosome-binding factor A